MSIRALWLEKSASPLPEAWKPVPPDAEPDMDDPDMDDPDMDMVMVNRADRSEIPRRAARSTASTGVERVVPEDCDG